MLCNFRNCIRVRVCVYIISYVNLCIERYVKGKENIDYVIDNQIITIFL